MWSVMGDHPYCMCVCVYIYIYIFFIFVYSYIYIYIYIFNVYVHTSKLSPVPPAYLSDKGEETETQLAG